MADHDQTSPLEGLLGPVPQSLFRCHVTSTDLNTEPAAIESHYASMQPLPDLVLGLDRNEIYDELTIHLNTTPSLPSQFMSFTLSLLVALQRLASLAHRGDVDITSLWLLHFDTKSYLEDHQDPILHVKSAVQKLRIPRVCEVMDENGTIHLEHHHEQWYGCANEMFDSEYLVYGSIDMRYIRCIRYVNLVNMGLHDLFPPSRWEYYDSILAEIIAENPGPWRGIRLLRQQLFYPTNTITDMQRSHCDIASAIARVWCPDNTDTQIELMFFILSLHDWEEGVVGTLKCSLQTLCHDRAYATAFDRLHIVPMDELLHHHDLPEIQCYQWLRKQIIEPIPQGSHVTRRGFGPASTFIDRDSEEASVGELTMQTAAQRYMQVAFQVEQPGASSVGLAEALARLRIS